MIGFLLSPLIGIVRWRFVLTPVAIYLSSLNDVSRRELYIFGVRVAYWTLIRR